MVHPKRDRASGLGVPDDYREQPHNQSAHTMNRAINSQRHPQQRRNEGDVGLTLAVGVGRFPAAEAKPRREISEQRKPVVEPRRRFAL
jgi:hypothetical protein